MELAERGDTEGLRARADTGDWSAGDRLAKVLAERGDTESLRAEVLRGNDCAARRLLDVLTTQHPA
jgi:hypothetical protein